MVMKF